MKITPAMVRRLVAKWRKRLEIDSKWEIDIEIHQKENEEQEDCRDAEAHVTTNDDVFYATLVINAWQIRTHRQLERAVAHECLHIVMSLIELAVFSAMGDRFEKFGRTILEQATDQIARALVKA